MKHTEQPRFWWRLEEVLRASFEEHGRTRYFATEWPEPERPRVMAAMAILEGQGKVVSRADIVPSGSKDVLSSGPLWGLEARLSEHSSDVLVAIYFDITPFWKKVMSQPKHKNTGENM